MEWLAFIKVSQVTFLSCIAVLALLIGSFLNVVVFRLPKMLHREWTIQCYEFLEKPSPASTETFNLFTPRSRCPHCQHVIAAWENIPIFSFLFLKGRCSACKKPISWRYPFIEALTMALSIVVAYYFGFSWQTFFALILTWSLLALAAIDIDHQILPDNITFPILWLGIIINIQSLFCPVTEALFGVIGGYLFLWSLYWCFKLITGKEGMGYGDFKLLAMLGAWLGWQSLPSIILLSSFSGAVVGITLIALKRQERSKPIPFGPFLALGGWITLIWGDKLRALYLTYFGLA